FDSFPPLRRPRKLKPLDPPAEECFRKAAELAPDWPNATRKLFEAMVRARKPDAAETAARALLAHRPDDLDALAGLAGLLQTQGRAVEAADLFRPAAALIPLDLGARPRTAFALLALARPQLIDGLAAAADALHDTSI